jgi:isorenieratene synthase
LRGHTQTFYSEHGIHGLWNNYRNVGAMLERFKIAPEIVAAQEQAWVHAEGERVQWGEVGSVIHNATLPPPLHYLELFGDHRFLSMMGLRDWLALPWVWRSLLLSVALDPFARLIPLEGQALEDFFRGWSPRLRAMFIGLARSGLASTPEKISLAAFIAAMRFYTVLRRDSLRFVYFAGDAGAELINPLIERLYERECELLLGHTAEGLTPLPGLTATPLPSPPGRGRRGRGWEVRVNTLRGLRTIFADYVILAVDPPAARRLLCESPATRAVAETLTWPEGLPNGMVRIWFDCQPRDGPEGGVFTGDFVVDNFFWLDRFQRDFVEWARLTGGSAIEMHLYRSEEFFNQPDAVILTHALTDVYRAYPELRGHVVHQTLQRNSATHTRLTVDKAERWLGVQTPWPNLYACGDWVRGPWPALFIERACVSGIEAANAVLNALGGEPFPIAAYDPPEWLAGKIQQWMLGGREWLKSLRHRQSL